jgi:hypothetical protein
MRRLLAGFCVFAAVHAANLTAEEPDSQAGRQEDPVSVPRNPPQQDLIPRFKGRALVLDINARVIEQNQTVIWNESLKKNTIPGRPVEIKLVGANIVVMAQFTPYVRRGVQKILVAHSQIWMEVPNQGIRFHTSMQAIPLEFGEPIYFFPLGPQSAEDTACIEVMLTLYPYEE